MYKYRVEIENVVTNTESYVTYPIAVRNMLCSVRTLWCMFGKFPTKWRATLWTGNVTDEHWQYQVFSGSFVEGGPIINEIKNHIV